MVRLIRGREDICFIERERELIYKYICRCTKQIT